MRMYITSRDIDMDKLKTLTIDTTWVATVIATDNHGAILIPRTLRV
jgi:hypothetical protein